MGSNTIIAIVIGAILVIVGFALWPVLNGASNGLYSYFRDSCDDGNGNRFLRVYVTVTGEKVVPNDQEFNTDTHMAGGKGTNLEAIPDTATVNIGGCMAAGDIATTATAVPAKTVLVNEQGERIGVTGADGSSNTLAVASVTIDDDYRYVEVAAVLQRFQGINNLLLTIIPVVSIAGFLGISGAKLYSYGKGTASIGSSISTSIFTLIGIVVAMVIAGPIMGALVDANQVVESGQYQVNGTFGNIIGLLFAMIPVVYVAGLVTLVGLQARSALMGGQ